MPSFSAFFPGRVFCRLSLALLTAFVVFFTAPAPIHAQLLTGYDPAPDQKTESASANTSQAVPAVQVDPAFSAFEAPPVQVSSAPVQAGGILTGYNVGVSQAGSGPGHSPNNPDAAPVDLQADRLSHDEQNQMITASGNVMLEQSGRILRADEVVYDLKADTVRASGHVVLNEANGDIHYAQDVELEDGMKNGFVQSLKSYLADGSRFTAQGGERSGGTKTVMKDANYTPCEPCKADPDRAPTWQIVASEVTHDEEAHRIAYENARFEVLGVPIAYTPYFSHSDGTIKRKSGFLSPAFGYKSDLGAFVDGSYYIDIAPDKDATLGAIAYSDVAPLGYLEYRQRWDNAALELHGGATYSDYEDKVDGVNILQEEDVRGHVLANGLWDIDEQWRAGLDVEWASDDQYMRQYDFVSEDVLKRELYAERFSGRDYAVARVLAFQDIRIREERVDQPQVLPEIDINFLGEPGSMPGLGGRWSFGTSFLGLRREGDNQDINRLSLESGWQRRLVSDYGLLTRIDATARADLYNTRDRDVATPGSGQSRSTSEARFYPNLNIQSSYPMVREFETMQATIEPIAALTVSPNLDVNNNIPNEDSQDVQIDASNLFEANRFPGMDRVEDQSRVTYGLRTGLHGYEGSSATVFLGQSYRLQEDDNPFPEGSGLSERSSDYVGQVSASYGTDYNLDYRFQLATDNLASQRHEVDAFADWGRFSLNSGYLYASALEGTDISESREQVRAAAGYYLSTDWRMRAGGTQDLGANSGLRRAFAALDYFGQCLSWSLEGQRNLTDDASGESDTEILFRIGLKNLGEFQQSSYRPADEEP